MADSRDLNVIELLIGIKEDVSSIKTDMANFKESQKSERKGINKDIADVRSDCNIALKSLETRCMGKLNSLQTVQNNLVGDVDMLKHATESREAKNWRKLISYVLTALGSALMARLPEIIKAIGGR